jgi:hypothetical protein
LQPITNHRNIPEEPGIVTLAKLVQPKNAPSPMLTTGRPKIMSAMVTAAAGALHLVTVIMPLLAV